MLLNEIETITVVGDVISVKFTTNPNWVRFNRDQFWEARLNDDQSLLHQLLHYMAETSIWGPNRS